MARVKANVQTDPSKSGSPMDDNRLERQRANRRRHRGSVDKADWRSADSAKLLAVVVAITQHGFAVRFGYTKDGGAFAVGVIGDGEPYTEFVRPTEDIDVFLDGLQADYAEAD